jgi:hypothetical protein
MVLPTQFAVLTKNNDFVKFFFIELIKKRGLAAKLLPGLLLLASFLPASGQANKNLKGFFGLQASMGLGVPPVFEQNDPGNLNPGFGFVPGFGAFYSRIIRQNYIVTTGLNLSRPSSAFVFKYPLEADKIIKRRFSMDVGWQVLSLPLLVTKDFGQNLPVQRKWAPTVSAGMHLNYSILAKINAGLMIANFDYVNGLSILSESVFSLNNKRSFFSSFAMTAGFARLSSKNERLETGLVFNWAPIKYGDGYFERSGDVDYFRTNFKVGFGHFGVYLKYGFPLIENPVAKNLN